MFEHSIKVPRHYKVAANIIKKVSTEGGSVKSLLYDSKLRHFKTNVLYALITETIKHAATIDKIFENCSILKNESRLDPWVAKVLTTELLFGKKALPGKSKPEQTILSYRDQFEKYTNEHQDDLKVEGVRRPRYVRINTNLLTTSDAIRAFQDEGYRFIRCTSGSYDDYLKQIQELTEDDFTQDYHVKTVFVFSAGTKLHEHQLYLENKIILQDKATTLAVHLLAPPAGSIVLDMCAAPGMKTTQLAAYMKNKGKIYAVERNEQRYKTLCDFVEKTGSTCVEALHKDSLEIKKGDYDDVEYIILDPSCSGSGMELSVHNYIDATRLSKLTSLQEKFLKHAMNSFPNAKRIVYSTCSVYSEENERVITNVVKTSRAKWRVQDIKELMKGNWNNFGSGMYGSMGYRCLYARPESDLTTGFFLAVLDRDVKDFEKQQLKLKNAADEVEMDNSNVNDDVGTVLRKKKKNNKYNLDSEDVNPESNNINSDHDKTTAEPVDTKKKKKKKKKIETTEETEIINIDSIEEDEEQKTIEKKKKKRKSSKESETNPSVELNENVIENEKKKTKKLKEILNNKDASIEKKRKSSKESETNPSVELIENVIENEKKKTKKLKEILNNKDASIEKKRKSSKESETNPSVELNENVIENEKKKTKKLKEILNNKDASIVKKRKASNESETKSSVELTEHLIENGKKKKIK